MYVAYIDSLLLLKTTPFFFKNANFDIKKRPFFQESRTCEVYPKAPRRAYHKSWRVGGPGGVHVTSQEKSLISGLSSLLLNHCQACQHFINYHRDRGPVNALKSGQFLPNRDFICIILIISKVISKLHLQTTLT